VIILLFGGEGGDTFPHVLNFCDSLCKIASLFGVFELHSAICNIPEILIILRSHKVQKKHEVLQPVSQSFMFCFRFLVQFLTFSMHSIIYDFDI